MVKTLHEIGLKSEYSYTREVCEGVLDSEPGETTSYKKFLFSKFEVAKKLVSMGFSSQDFAIYEDENSDVVRILRKN